MDTLKKELWELLRIFDHICREEHIDYWVDYGTLLGAVRHQGFIPWDDDIDVSMRYEDYLRFFEVCDKYFPPNVRAVNYDRRKDCITPFRGYLQNTSILLEDVLGDTIMAFIDIFFYTGVPENPYARRLDQMNLLWKSLRVTKTPLSEDKGNSIARTAKKAFNRLIIDHNNPRRTQRVMSSCLLYTSASSFTARDSPAGHHTPEDRGGHPPAWRQWPPLPPHCCAGSRRESRKPRRSW